MFRSLLVFVSLLLSMFFSAGEVLAEESEKKESVKKASVSPRAIMKKVYHHNDFHAKKTLEVKMILSDKKGRKKERFFKLYQKKIKDGKGLKIVFYKPTSVKGTSMLSRTENDEKTQWMYFPALKALKNIKGNKGRESFMGSDFTYDDISGRPLSKDSFSILKEDKDYWYIKAVPKGDSHYHHMVHKVHKKLFLAELVEFYSAPQKKIKTLENKSVRKVDSVYLVTHSIMKSHKRGSTTSLLVNDIDVKTNISEADVSLQSLKR